MKKILLVLLAFNLCLARVFAQQVSFQIQAGLSTSIKEILTIEKDRVLCVATADGNLLLWDVTRNKLSNRIPLDAEIYDIEFLPSSQVLAIATPAKIFLHKYESGKLEPMSEYYCENPTALWASASHLWVAAEKEILQLDLSGTYPEMLSRTPSGRGAAYTLRVFDDKVLLASNGGVSVYRISGESIKSGPDTSTVEISDMDTSAIGNDEQEVKGLIERDEFNTGWYAHYWNEGRQQLIVSRESRLLVFEYANQQVTSQSFDIPSLSKGNITGIIRLDDKLMIGTNEGLLFQLSYPLKMGEIPKRFEMKSGSVTHLNELTGLLVTGDFYGNVVISDPASLEEIMTMNDESIPALTGVYLDSRNRMITAHKDPKGAQVRIWDLSRASLEKAIRFPAQQIINVRIEGDTIETHHADLSIYRITGGAGGYDTSNIQQPITPYVPGFEIDLPDADPMLLIEGNRVHLREAARMPGTYQWLDSVSGRKVIYTIPPLVQCESLPPYYVVEAFYRDAGILGYMETWDTFDKDMFYMKACRYTEEQFLKYAATTNIPPEKSLAFFRRIKNPAVSTLRVFDEGTRDTLFTLKQNGLQFLQYHPEERSWVMFYDSAAYLFGMGERKLERINISLPPGMFHYDFYESSLAITSVNKTMVYARNKTASTSWLSFGDQDFLVYNQDGYYRTRGRSDRLVGYENGQEKPFSYFDLKYNRPDILLMQITGGNDEEGRVFARAFEKRKQKMKGKLPVWANAFNENLFPAYMPLYNKEGYVVIPSKVDAQIQINSFVNGVLVAAGSQPGTRIELSPGLNRVEFQYSNMRGDTIYEVKEQYVYSTVKREQRWYFFGGGIDQYNDASLNLDYAVKDILDLSRALREHKKNVVVDTRKNEQLEAGGWSDWKQKLSRTSVNDVVLVSLSGHGYLDSLGNFYLASHRSTADHFLPAISYDQILDLVDAAPARRRIIFLDACHSGLLDDESTSKALPEGVTVKSFIRKKQASTGTLPFRVMQEEFLDLARHKGTMVIAAAAGSEFAMESSAQKNGLFTFALMQGIFEHKADRNNDRRITTSELREYLGREVEILSGGGQKPTINQDNQGPEWNIIEY